MEWYIWSKALGYIKELQFDNDILISEKDSTQIKEESNQRKKTRDSLLKNPNPKSIEIESEFKGGITAWGNYLSKNFRYPKTAIKKKIQGTVIIQFIVDKDGKVTDVLVVKSVEFSLDQEALRIIRRSPDWIPAEQNGKKVKSYKKQPIVFSLQTQ